MIEIAEMLELHPSEVCDTMSFYGFFGTPSIRWASIACGSAAASRACSAAARSCSLDCQPKGRRTGHDGRRQSLTLEFAECLGACEGAPCILVDDECHMNPNAKSRRRQLVDST